METQKENLSHNLPSSGNLNYLDAFSQEVALNTLLSKGVKNAKTITRPMTAIGYHKKSSRVKSSEVNT